MPNLFRDRTTSKRNRMYDKRILITRSDLGLPLRPRYHASWSTLGLAAGVLPSLTLNTIVYHFFEPNVYARLDLVFEAVVLSFIGSRIFFNWLGRRLDAYHKSIVAEEDAFMAYLDSPNFPALSTTADNKTPVFISISR